MDKNKKNSKVIVKEGDIVFLTRHYAEWIKMLKGDLDISLICPYRMLGIVFFLLEIVNEIR